MADLTDLQAAGSTKIVGSDSTGLETNAVGANSDGSLFVSSPDRSGSGSLTALDTVVTANTQGMSTVNFNVTGTWVGTVRAEGTLDGGTTWILLVSVGTAQSIFATSTTNDIFKVACGGYSQVRMRMSAYTSGTANIIWDAGVGVGPTQVWNTNAVSLKTTPRSDILATSGSASALNSDIQSAIDLGGYSSVSIQITGTYVGTISFQGSNDNSNWFPIYGYDISNPFVYQISSIDNLTGIYYIPLECRYFRARMTAYTSGTASAITITDTLTSGQSKPVPVFWSRSDTFTTTGNGVTISSSLTPMKYFTIDVKQTGTVTSWNVVLEGSIDNIDFTTIANHTNVIGSGVSVFSGANVSMCLYFRARCSAITLGSGTNIIAKIIGSQ